MKKKQKIIIAIIGIITVILISGLTYAFFSANPVGGNSTTNTIVTMTADYGDIIVTYDASDGSIDANNIDLKESEKGTDKLYLLKFKIESTANIARDITIKWKEVTNTFCQYANGQTCTNEETDTYVGDEVSYNIYSCSLENYNNATTSNVSTNCTSIGSNALPKTGSTEKVTTNDYVTLIPTSTSYYVILVRLENKETEQNYNQGRSYTGQIKVNNRTDVIALDGYLYDENGDALADTDLELHSDPIYKTTDAEGYFNFGEVEVGTHTIIAKDTSENVILNDTITVLKDTTNSVEGKTIKSPSSVTVDLKSSEENTIETISLYEDRYKLTNVILAAYTPVSDAISSAYVSSASGIDFNAVNSPTNGQGLYINNKNSESGDVKYFRGGTYCAYTNYTTEDTSGAKCTAVGGTWDSTTYHCSLNDSESACTTAGFTYYELKNNVMFGGYAWKIIRINADGSIRMIYNGTSSTARGTSSQIGTSIYKTSPNNDNAYVGYMYGVAGSTTYEATHTNTNNSTIKTYIDSWYSSNLISYADKIADSGFCGDRSLSSGLGYGTNETYYGAYNRLVSNKTPTFSCTNSNDLYTLSTNSSGNKALTYPIGLITVDEVAYAGTKYVINNFTYYLQNGTIYWTMSPYFFRSSDSSGFAIYIYSYGYWNGNFISNANGVRPVINLKSDVIVSSGTGSLSDPWMISTT